MLSETIKSLSANCFDAKNVAVHLLFDEDDETYHGGAWKAAAHSTEFPVHVCLMKRGRGLASAYNALAKHSGGEIILGMADDQKVISPNWDKHILDNVPDSKYWVGWLHDTLQPTTRTYWVLPRSFYKKTGYVCAPIFRFWFHDTWLKEIGQMINREILFPVKLEPQWEDGKGKTHRMRHIAFWAAIFEVTRKNRVAEASALLEDMGEEFKPDLEMLARFEQENAPLLNPLIALETEAAFSEYPLQYEDELNALRMLSGQEART